jgi:nitrite reductase (NADH) small subunit/3-phenylpropionate/trans-cinnamate dioxygenase ferredoxin subunit
MNDFVRATSLQDVPPGTCRTVEVDGTFVALFNIDGMIYALDNTCPHAGGPLGEGTIVGDCVKCPWHGWRFNIRTGIRPENPDFHVPRRAVRIEDNMILVSRALSP